MLYAPRSDRFLHRSCRHRYSQYLTAQVVDSDGRSIKNTRSSFYHFLSRLEWVPAYRPLEGERQERKYLCPSSVYLTSPEVTDLLGTHVYYVDIQSSEFSRALGEYVPTVLLLQVEAVTRWARCYFLSRLLGMRESVSVDDLIQYLKEWCVRPEADDQEQRHPEDEAQGANFTTTVQHIHNVYTFLHTNCPPSRLKELFQHTPAVFVE